MESDSESQDSDDGRRFRFETTRKDSASLPKRKLSPQRSRHDRRSRSRDRSTRDDKSRHSKDDDARRRNRSPNDRDANNRHSLKDRSSKDSKNSSRDSSSRRQHESKDSRSYRTKDSRGYDSRESRDSKDRSDGKHKSKAREKHKKHSRDRSRERSGQIEDAPKKEEKDPDSVPVEAEEIKQRPMKKQRMEESEKVNHKSVEKPTELASYNPVAVSDIGVSRTSASVDTAPARKKPRSFFDRVVNKGNNDEDSSIYGPSLPPSLEKKMLNARDKELDTVKYVQKVESLPKSEDDDLITIGPVLPPVMRTPSLVQKDDNNSAKDDEKNVDTNKMEVEEDEEVEEDSAIGPALPPNFNRREIVGPMLPKNFVIPSDTLDTIEISKSDEEKEDVGDDDDDDDDVVGPLPADHPAARGSYVQMQLEHRARQVKERFRDKTSPDKNKREEWMVELPPSHAVALGLGSIPRKFKTREGPDMSDRSMWTDTPADRLRKQKEKEENRFIPSEESRKKSKKSKDKDAAETQIDERKGESLLDMHLKSLKKKKKKVEKEAKELGLPTRRPFDRDVDLQVNRLDDARKKKIFEKASRLNDRFTVGKI